ncbi:MFS transporter [Microbacterium sp. Ru50]|uniref:MFS transporter n=1 Tax=Microbacterium sp. Ru50 TaxID=2080744 RepID=UPI000CDD12A3|nr:MFS transporter [Microbacterium sp. Ru50]POX68341.1 MFS transporter [Microbacterium sp. Ru50]
MPEHRGSASSPSSTARSGVFDARHRGLTAGILLSVGMVAFESLGVATVLPVIARDLDGLGAYGWGLSALMLANIVGTVTAGHMADRRGAARPLALGMLVFLTGCMIAGVSGSWSLFLLGRVVQGIGVGAVMAASYTAIGRAYPESLRAQMFALLSSAWTIPSLVGPLLAGIAADLVGWRWVFVAMVPLIIAAMALTLPRLRRVADAGPAHAQKTTARGARWWRGPLASSLLLTLGTALLLQALLLADLVLMAVGAILGLGVALVAFRRVTPEGTLSARAGLGAGVIVRLLLSGAYFGSEAFLPLAFQELRGQTPAAAGLALSAGALTWVAGSLLQARWDRRHHGRRSRAVAGGAAVLLLGTVAIAVTALVEAVPGWCAIAGWAIGGLGMGIAFNASTTDTMEQAPDGQQGQVSSALQLAQTLATAVIAGVGGAIVASAAGAAESLHSAIATVFAVTAALAALALALSGRLRPAAGRSDTVRANAAR